MPVRIKKLSSGKYKVTTPHGTKSKGTTKENAEAQERLLNAVEHTNWRPTGKPSKRTVKKQVKIPVKRPKKKSRGK